MRVLSSHVVHRFGEPLHDPGQLALATWNEAPRPAHSVPPFSEPELGGSASPRADHVFGLGTVDGLEGFVQAAQGFHRRRKLIVVRRVLFDVLHKAGGLHDFTPPVPPPPARDADTGASPWM